MDFSIDLEWVKNMRKFFLNYLFVCLLGLIPGKNAFAEKIEAGSSPLQAQQICNNLSCFNLFKGAWFEIKHPATFTPRIIKKSSTKQDGADAAVFLSPDNLVEFYIFSPQWAGVAPEIELNPKIEKLDSRKSAKTKNGTITWISISSLRGDYIRSYQDFESISGDIHWVVGIKYRDMNAYERYKNQYILFKKSLIQFADH
jgi:hypothetical protein